MVKLLGRSRTTVLIWLCLAAVTPAQEKAKRPMGFMDIMEMRSVGGGDISPDGRRVVYTISIPHWKSGKNYTDIFVAMADGGGAPRRMTFTTEKNEASPQWARDSRQFAFLSNRDASGTSTTNQLYLMHSDGGEARKVSDAAQGVNAFAFSRDGKWLAFSAGRAEDRQLWLVDLTKDDAAPVQLTKHASPVGAWAWQYDSARIFFLAPESVDKDEAKRREKKFDVRIINPPRPPNLLWSVSIAEKSEKRWTEGKEYGVQSFTQSRDGAWIAFRSASLDRYAAGSAIDEGENYLLNVGTGAIRRITNNKSGESAPRFSPDSKWLVFGAGDDFDNFRNRKFYVMAVPGGEPRKLLGEWDHSAGNPFWSADSKAIYFTEGIGVDQHWFAVDAASGKLSQLTRERGVAGGSFDDESGLFLLTFTDPTQPTDYYVARPESIATRGRWARVSNGNPQVAGFQLGEYETVRWKSSDGQMVEGILVKPVGYEAGKKYPLIVQLHGGPAAADTNNFSGNYGDYVHVFAANGYAILQPNYRGSDNYGEKFRMQIAGDYFRQAYDDIIAGVDFLIARGIADPDKLGMMGWSAGGHWSNWTLTHSDRFKAISSGAGAMNWISMYAQTDVQAPREFYFKGKPWKNWDHFLEVSPLKYIKNAKTPTLIHVCEGDPRVPKPQSDELHMALKKLGVPTEYIVYPLNTHGIGEPRYQMVKMVSEFNWFEKWIKGKPGWLDWKQLLATLEEPKKEAESQRTESN